MAYTIPETIPRKATAGERLLFQTLKEHLPDDDMISDKINTYEW